LVLARLVWLATSLSDWAGEVDMVTAASVLPGDAAVSLLAASESWFAALVSSWACKSDSSLTLVALWYASEAGRLTGTRWFTALPARWTWLVEDVTSASARPPDTSVA